MAGEVSKGGEVRKRWRKMGCPRKTERGALEEMMRMHIF